MSKVGLEDLLSSLGPSELSQEQIKALSQKLETLLPGQTNEDGLPIVDIAEPESSSLPPTDPIIDEPDIIPLVQLTPEERERRIKERDRILAELEEEEATEETYSQISEDQTLQARREQAKKELERIKKERELSKKMGKALLRNMADAREKEQSTSSSQLKPSSSLKEPSLGPKKSVTFDVPPTPTDADGAPMKFKVVERIPSRPAEPPRIQHRQSDSDDETDEEEDLQTRSSIQNPPPPDSASDSDTANEDLDPADETDLDSAMHQREIALAYYAQRPSVTAKAKDAVANMQDENEWDQAHVPLEATLSHDPPKPSQSKYRSSLPSSVVQRAIRTGTLTPSGELQGAESDDDDVEKEAREIMELLSRGDVYNAGKIDPKPEEAPVTPALGRKEKISRFKINRSQFQQLPLESDEPTTPINDFGRSSPKFPWSASSSAINFTPPGAGISMVIESPSFPAAPALSGNATSAGKRACGPPMVMATSVSERMPSERVEIGNSREWEKVSRFKAGRS